MMPSCTVNNHLVDTPYYIFLEASRTSVFNNLNVLGKSTVDLAKTVHAIVALPRQRGPADI